VILYSLFLGKDIVCMIYHIVFLLLFLAIFIDTIRRFAIEYKKCGKNSSEYNKVKKKRLIFLLIIICLIDLTVCSFIVMHW